MTQGPRSTPFRLLYSYGVLFEILGYSRSGDEETASDASGRLYLSVAFGLTCSTALALLCTPIKEPFRYALMLGSLSAVFVAIQTSCELMPFLNPPDQAIVGHLPVRSNVRLFARYAVLATLITLQFLNWNLAPAIVAAVSLRSMAVLFSYLVSSFLMSLTVVAGVLAINAVAVAVFRWQRVREALVYVQVASTVAILTAVFGLPKLVQGGGASVGSWIQELGLWWPPAWFAHLFCALAGHGFDVAGVLLALLATLAAIGPFLLLARAYERFLKRLAPAPPVVRTSSLAGALVDFAARCLASKGERPFFRFAAINFRRDRGFRLRCYPLLVYPIAILVFAGRDTADHFFVMMLQVVALYMVVIVALVPFSDHPKAAWLLNVLPIASRSSHLIGVEKAFLTTLLFPVYALVAIALCFVWRSGIAVAQAALASLFGCVVVAIAFRRLQALPFSREFRGDLASREITSQLMGYLALLVIAGLVQYAFGRSVVGFLAIALVCIALVAVLWRRGGAQ